MWWWQLHLLHHLHSEFSMSGDVLWSPSLGGEVLDKRIDGGDRSNGSGGRCGRGRGFGVSDHLETVVSLGFPW